MTNAFAFPAYVEISQVMDWLQDETGEPLLGSDTELRDIIALMPHPLFIKNSQSQVVMMNQACEALWGVSSAEAVGTNGSAHLPPEQIKLLRQHDLHAFASNRTCIDEAYVWNKVRQGMGWLLTYKRPTYRRDGTPHLLICSAIDITERKQKEAALEQALEQTRQVAAQQRDAMESQHRRLALDTQDNLAQNLLALKLDITMLHARTGEQQPLLHERAAQAMETLNASISAVRDIINELHPATLELGLSAAIEWQLQQMARRQGLQYRLLIPHDSATLDQQQTSAVYHVVQAGLHYLVAGASQLQVELDLQPARLTITLSSDHAGTGDTTPLYAMQERLATLGGTLAVAARSLQITI
ncbi:PAS domain S-box-containing protein [Duganella sp. CF402]|uniref:PAS domain-containing sensor histidine kinase n=1 Tax=unclassified Duganella TaxID=2636909 RepID=UPI0008B721AA|nr:MULTISPECIES: PAS domain-containing protein [unclassified Duganella]RZT11286.1 PAS domain S-box-containing protein [Duganella sp. BK701]SEK72489.1 PAS domain S-box-containing protein [Duganella sp. CF402]